MAQPTPANLFRHSLREGGADLLVWAREHVLATAVSLVAALLGIPVYLRFQGVSMSALQDQLAQVMAYSLAGPILLIALAYIYFVLRAPSKLYAKRVEELRDLRLVMGRPIDDLEEPETKGWFKSFVARNSLRGLFAVVLFLSFLLFNLIGALGQLAIQYKIANALNVVWVNTDRIYIIMLQAIADDAVAICDEDKSKSKRCDGARLFAKKFLTIEKLREAAFRAHQAPPSTGRKTSH